MTAGQHTGPYNNDYKIELTVEIPAGLSSLPLELFSITDSGPVNESWALDNVELFAYSHSDIDTIETSVSWDLTTSPFVENLIASGDRSDQISLPAIISTIFSVVIRAPIRLLVAPVRTFSLVV